MGDLRIALAAQSRASTTEELIHSAVCANLPARRTCRNRQSPPSFYFGFMFRVFSRRAFRVQPRVVAQRCSYPIRGLAVSTMPVPSLGDTIVDGTVLSIEKPAGSTVQADDVLVVIETDKVC